MLLDQCQQRIDINAFVPHLSASFIESLLPVDKTIKSELFAFDHLPTRASWSTLASDPLRQCKGFGAFEIGEIIARSRALCAFVFHDSVALATRVFATAVTTGSFTSLPSTSDVAAVWGVWSVVQRGHNAVSFADCVVEAWKLCELVPTLLCTHSRGNASGTASETIFLTLDTETNAEHLQLLAAMACVIADSLSILVPPGASVGRMLCTDRKHSISVVCRSAPWWSVLLPVVA